MDSQAIFKLEMKESDAQAMWEITTRLARITESFEPHIDKAADRIRLGFQRNFESESAGGQPWHELAPWTVEERGRLRRQYGWPIMPEHPILRRTGALRQSVIEKGHPLHVCEVDSSLARIDVEIGSADPRFEILHGGGVNEDGYNVPARPMTVLGDSDIDGLRQTLEWIAAELAKGGF